MADARVGDSLVNDYRRDKRALTKKASELESRLVNRVIMFIDLVDSTAFKRRAGEEVSIWITFLADFYEIIHEYVTKHSGTLVKYIGDEALATFQESHIESAAQLLKNLPEIEREILARTSIAARIKIAADFGSVYEFTIIDHAHPDPLGIPVDRCARIAKRCGPSTVLISGELYSRSLQSGESSSFWSQPIRVNAHGLETITIHQLLGQGQIVEQVLAPEARVTDDELTPIQRELRQRVYADAYEIEQVGEVMPGVDFSSKIEGELRNLQCDGTVLAVCGVKKLLGKDSNYYGYFYDFARHSFQTQHSRKRVRVCRIFLPDENGFSTNQENAIRDHDENKGFGVQAVRIPLEDRVKVLEDAWAKTIARFNSDYGFGYVVFIHPGQFVAYTHELADLDPESPRLRVLTLRSKRNAGELVKMFSQLLKFGKWPSSPDRAEDRMRMGLESLLRDYQA